MAILDFLKPKPKVTQVVIPEHYINKGKESLNKIRATAKTNQCYFKVTKLIPFPKTLFLLGKVQNSQLRAGMVLEWNGRKYTITSVQLDNKEVEILPAFSEGSIALDKYPSGIEEGMTLEFKFQVQSAQPAENTNQSTDQ